MIMHKFRKKPLIVEAVQYKGPTYVDTYGPGGDYAEFTKLPEGVYWRMAEMDRYYPTIKTLEGEMRVSPNDWVIKGIAGEIYPCKDSIFKKTYEPVDNMPPGTDEREFCERLATDFMFTHEGLPDPKRTAINATIPQLADLIEQARRPLLERLNFLETGLDKISQGLKGILEDKPTISNPHKHTCS